MSTTEPMTEEQAVESLLIHEDTPDDVEGVEDVADDVTSAELAEDEAEGEVSDDTEDDAPEDADQDESDDAEEEADEQPQRFTVKVDGAEVEVTLDELTQSFSGQKYIQKGMQEAAEQKKQAEAAFTALQQEQARLAQLYQNMQQGGFVPEPQKPSPQMAQDDPIGYIGAMAEYDEKKAAYDAQQAELSNVSAQQTQAQQRAMQMYVAEQSKILERDIPELSDAVKGKELKSALRETGQSYGFSDQEISQIFDARAVKVLHDAMQYRKLKASRAVVEQKAKKARPVTKPKAPRKINAEAKKREAMRKQLKDTGSIDAAVELLMGN